MRRLFLSVSLAVGLLLPPTILAQDYPFCAPGQTPAFVFGFKALKDAVGEPMGEPLECEHTEPATGDAHQRTTTGLSFYRKSTNTPTFTNGWEHWALTGRGLVYWTGESIDPPPTARPVPAQTAPVAPSGEQVFAEWCAGCHGAAGEGIARAPALIGPNSDLGRYTPEGLYDFIRRNMPADSPGSLSDEEYRAVTAFLREANQLP